MEIILKGNIIEANSKLKKKDFLIQCGIYQVSSINIKEIQKKGDLIFEGTFKNGLFYKKLNGDYIEHNSYKEKEDENIIYKTEYQDSGYI